MNVKERVAYIRGLLEGPNAQVDPSTRMIWDHVLQVCDGLADSVELLTEAQREVEDYVEAMDEDLNYLEQHVSTSEQEREKIADDYVASDEDDEDSVVRAECPRCGEEAFFDEAYLYDDRVEISCPECGEILYRGGQYTEDEEADSAPIHDNDVYEPVVETSDYTE